MRKNKITVWFLVLMIPLPNLWAEKENVFMPPLEYVEGDSMLCGINSLYIALRLFGEENIEYKTLLASFSDVRRRGISLQELKSFFERKTYYCVTNEISELEITQLPSSTVAIALTQYGEYNYHLTTKISDGNGSLLVADADQGLKKISPGQLNETKQMTLLVSTIPITLEETQSPWLYLSFLLTAILLSLTFFSMTKLKKSNP